MPEKQMWQYTFFTVSVFPPFLPRYACRYCEKRRIINFKQYQDMVKKVLTLFLGLIAASSLMAQSEPKSVTINESDIQFWVGNGSNSSVVAIGWDATNASYTPTVVVWGIHWNGSITLLDALDSIATHDSRFTYTVSGSFLSTLDYNDPTAGVHLSPYQMWNCNSYNGVYGSTTLTSTWLRISESTCDNYNFTGVNNLIYASDPNGPATTDPVDATIDTSSILYWVGTGDKRAVFIVNWGAPDTALAWGYRFNSGATINNMIADIDAADPRFWIEGSPSYNGDIHFVTSTGDTLGLSPVDPTIGYNFWWTNLNGVSVASLSTALQDNDFFKYGDYNVATGWDYQSGYYMQEAWTTIPNPVPAPDNDQTPDEATIAASDIVYWVGEGSNQVVMAVNWADTALAWGYRFNGTKTVNDMMDEIAAADPRFSYTMDGYYLNDINFNDGSRTLTITPGKYWSSSNNGIMDAGMSQTLVNGDFEKWADPAAGIIVDSTYDETYHYWWYTYAYPMAINAVSQPAAMGPFCGVVGTTGCTAIAYNDNRIKAWATGCTLVLGSQNLSDPSAPVVTYGTADEAVGAASTSTMDVVSLGDGGSATLTFEKPIANGDGYDFAVFENSFNDYFLELAFVEVSSDGERFVRFPATSLTQTARQITSSVDPTYINNLAGKYRVGYGTPFDLNELRDSAGLDINNITHVRVIDVVGSIDPELGTHDAFGHIINDPFPTITYSAGFDLDGIAVLNQKTERIELAENGVQMSVYPNPATDRICVTLENLENIDATLFDMSGRAVKTLTLRNGDNTIDISTLQNGIYLIRVAGSVTKIVKK